MLVVCALAVARATALVVADDITQPLRDAALRRLHAGSPIAELITCPWCVSMWLAFGAAPLAWWYGTHPAVAIPALALAFSQIAGMVSNIGRG